MEFLDFPDTVIGYEVLFEKKIDSKLLTNVSYFM